MANDSNRRLWLSITFAVLVHAILLFTVNFKSQPQATLAPPILTVLLSKPIRNEVKEIQNIQFIPVEDHPAMIKSLKKVFASPGKVSINSTVKVPYSIQSPAEENLIQNEKSNVEQTKRNEVISANRLQSVLENAREIARKEGRQLEKKETLLDNKKLSSQNALSAALENAFKLDNTSEQKVVKYANGMIEVVTGYGTKYCLVPPKNFESGGPVDAQYMTMTCP